MLGLTPLYFPKFRRVYSCKLRSFRVMLGSRLEVDKNDTGECG